MSGLEIAYAQGQLAALSRLKQGALAPTNPTVRRSAVNSGTPAQLPQLLKTPPTPPLDPPTLARQFSDVEQNETRVQPLRKLSAENLCTTCRKEKHYGSCKRPVAIPIKRADFNTGMTGDDPSAGDNPSTSPHYTSATTSTSALTRAQEGRPADEQASTAFRDLLRARDLMMPDEGGLLTSGLAKVSTLIRTKLREGRGPTTNPYEERTPRPVPVIGRGEDGTSNIWRSFDSTNGDVTSVSGGAGTPTGEPSA